MTEEMVEAGFGLGSNLGDKEQYVRRAAQQLAASGLVEDLILSSLYRTAPWGPVAQDWFVNACAVARTRAAPRALLDLCRSIEMRLGRERIVRWGPRTIDVDLLYCDDFRLDKPDLRLPHPHMLNRAFVLVPLLELRPALVIGGVRIADALAKLDTGDVIRLGG